MPNKQKGFSIIESMIALGILGGAIMAASHYIGRISETRSLRLTQTMFKFMAIQTSQTIVMNPGFFPPITPGGATVNYAGCFGKNGVLVKNTNGIRAFVYLRADLASEAYSGVCDGSAFFESRFRWVVPPAGQGYREVVINILNLKREKNDNFKAKTYTILAR